jgi:type II secretory pathway pseudopilin PulG
MLLALVRQQQQQLSSVERELTAARSEAFRLSRLVQELSATLEAQQPPTARSEAVAAANAAALRAEVRRFLAASGAARVVPAGSEGSSSSSSSSSAEDAASPWAQPLRVTISCPCEAKVTAMPLGEDDRPGGECLVLDVAGEGSSLSGRFVLYCENEAQEAAAAAEAAEADSARAAAEAAEAAAAEAEQRAEL